LPDRLWVLGPLSYEGVKLGRLGRFVRTQIFKFFLHHPNNGLENVSIIFICLSSTQKKKEEEEENYF
jgi:hypothetical protein